MTPGCGSRRNKAGWCIHNLLQPGSSAYAPTESLIYRKKKKITDKPTKFPLWTNCQGRKKAYWFEFRNEGKELKLNFEAVQAHQLVGEMVPPSNGMGSWHRNHVGTTFVSRCVCGWWWLQISRTSDLDRRQQSSSSSSIYLIACMEIITTGSC